MKGMSNTIFTAACLVGLALILAPAPAAADYLHLDDVIIDGSLCVGFDCVNGESFGADTIRLKENNLRIHFDDTSSAASYPRNDWRILINSKNNGGGSYFAVEDAFTARIPFTIEAGALSNSLYIDDGGRLGLRTSTPSTEIHTIDGDTPTLRLQQDGSSGFAPHTWDVAGNETNFFIRDVTEGSALPFRIRPGAPTNSIYIDADGDVGIGTASPEQPVHISRSSANVNFRLQRTDAGGNGWDLRHNSANQFSINEAGVGARLTLEPTSGDMEISGELTTGGTTCGGGGCDRVFSPESEIESIDEHAAEMWRNRHLPAIGPTAENQPFNLTQKTGGLIHELEKAHIYIEQLHQRLAKVEAQLAAAQGAD